jgi:hypothetical protein
MSANQEEEMGSTADLFELPEDMFETVAASQNNNEGLVSDEVEKVDDTVDAPVVDDTTEAVEETETETEESEETSEVEETEETEETEDSEEEFEEEDAGYADLIRSFAEDGTFEFDEEADYEPTQDGMKKLIEETVNKRAEEAVNKYRENLFGNNPDVQEFFEYAEKGMTFEQYQKLKDLPDYDSIDVTNERNQELLVSELLSQQNYPAETIQRVIKSYKDSGQLDEHADIAQRQLSGMVKDYKEQQAKIAEQENAQREQQAQIDAENFRKEILNMKEVKGFSLGKTGSEELYDYITKPVNKEGQTQFQLDDNFESKMLYAWMTKNNFDSKKLLRKAASKQTIKLKRSLNSDPAASAKNAGQVRRTKTKVVEEIPDFTGMWDNVEIS